MNARKLAVWALLLCLGGCSAKAPTPLPGEQVQLALAQLPSAAADAALFATLFAEGAAPGEAERPKYALLSFHLLDAQLDGKAGRAKVLLQDLEGHKVGESDWIVVKEKGAWKFKHAPLP